MYMKQSRLSCGAWDAHRMLYDAKRAVSLANISCDCTGSLRGGRTVVDGQMAEAIAAMRNAKALLGQGPKLHGIQAHSINSGVARVTPPGWDCHAADQHTAVPMIGKRGCSVVMHLQRLRRRYAGMKKASGQLDSVRRGLSMLTRQLQQNGLQQDLRRVPGCMHALSSDVPRVVVPCLRHCTMWCMVTNYRQDEVLGVCAWQARARQRPAAHAVQPMARTALPQGAAVCTCFQGTQGRTAFARRKLPCTAITTLTLPGCLGGSCQR